MPGHWGHGYATEAAIACREFAFREKLAPRLISLIHPENVRSQAVARRNGMSLLKESTFKNIPVWIFGVEAPR
jgi:RimJ/RimL family protein N-acetyltransferase